MRWPVGWEALGQWGTDAARIEPLVGGVANDVWSVRVRGRLAVGRLGSRGDADLAWETELLRHRDREGLAVPVPIPTTDGRLFADGLVVMTYVEGRPPETEADWRRVADTLRRLHRLTRGWPQRPGWRASTDLLSAETGTKVDLGAMPGGVGAAQWARDVRRPRRPQPAQRPRDRGARRADRLGRGARRRARPRPGAAPQRRRPRRRRLRRRRAGVGRVGGLRLLGRRVRGQAARRSPGGLSGGGESRDRILCRRSSPAGTGTASTSHIRGVFTPAAPANDGM